MTPVTVTTLGSCGAWPEPGRACSGTLVQYEGAALVVDLGWGTLTRLLERLGDPAAAHLAGVMITHDHPDHTADLPALLRARWYAARELAPLPLICPDAVLDRLRSTEEGAEQTVSRVFDVRGVPAAGVRIGPFDLTTRRLPHHVENIGVRITAAGRRIACTGDTGPEDAVAELGRDTDLFIVDSTDRYQRADAVGRRPGTPALNLTAAEAGSLAARAGARRLMLTHFWPGNDRERSRRAAAAQFGGEVLLAEEGCTVTLH